jgi:hypothetical protein
VKDHGPARTEIAVGARQRFAALAAEDTVDVKPGANMKASFASRRQRPASSGVGAGLIPSASITSCEPEREDWARLPCLATVTPQPATMNDASVEMFTDREPSPPVPQVSRQTS